MPGSKTDFLENALLNHSLGGGDYTRPATVYLGLFSVAPTDAAGGTEITGGAYPRKAVTNNSTNFPAASGGSKSLAVTQEFDVAPAGLADAVAFGIFDAATGGNLLFWAWLGSDAGKTFYGRASDNVLIAPGHTLINNDQVRVLARPGETLPTGISAGTTYFVVGVSGNTLQLSLTQGGAAIDITADGVGLVAKITVKPLTEGDTPRFSGGALVVGED